MTQTQNEKDTLLCTFTDCKTPQCEDSEFCEAHSSSLTPIQQEALKKPCPNCGTGQLHEVEGDNEAGENYLYCNNCLLSMDGDGGYTK